MSYNETLERHYLRSIPQEGKVEWIGIRSERRAEVQSVSQAYANPDTGLEGDHFKKSSTGKRQVTLIQQEHLDVVDRILGKSDIAPESLRRNIVVSGTFKYSGVFSEQIKRVDSGSQKALLSWKLSQGTR